MYTGMEAKITLGQLGLLTDVPPSDVPPGALIKAKNISFETGLLSKARGSKRYNRNALPAPIVALIDWWPDTTSQRMIAACSNGSIYRDINDKEFSGNVAVATGLGALSPKSTFTEGGQETAGRSRKLFFLSGVSQVQVLSGDGTTFAPISQPAADWTGVNFPNVGLIHQNRFWAFVGQMAYASDTGDHENFISNNLVSNIFPGEGGAITGAFVYKGRLFTFKDGGFVYYLDDADPDSTNWVWRKLSSNFGLSSPHGIIEAIDDMIAVNESGSPVSYAATQKLGEIESADILRMLQIEEYFRESTNLAGLQEMHALYYEAKKTAYFTWRTSHRSTNDMLLVLDFNRETPRPAFWTKDQVNCLALRRDIYKVDRPMYGSADGFVYLMDQEDRLTHDAAYSGEFKTGHMDFKWLDSKLGERNKLFDFLSVEFVPQGTWDLLVDVYIDGNFSETINYSMDVRDDGLDAFTLDTDPLGREESQTIRKPLHGSGRRISFHARQAGANQNFQIASITVGFRTSAEQATRV